MSVQVQGTANPDPLTQTTEPTSPVTGMALTIGQQGSITVGPYTNNSPVTLKISSVSVTNTTNLSSITPPTTPITVAAGASTNLPFIGVRASNAGPYSFQVNVSWTTSV